MNADKAITLEPFDFYGTGEVAPPSGEPQVQPSLPDPRESRGYLFRLEASTPLWLALIYPVGLDDSMYAEVGNLLASQEAARIGSLEDSPVMISPPEALSQPAIARILKSATSSTLLLHRRQDFVVQLRLVRLSGTSEGSGHA